MEDKKIRKQMAFDVTPEMHKRIKILAAMRNISINMWLVRAINDRLAKEAKYDQEPEQCLQSSTHYINQQ